MTSKVMTTLAACLVVCGICAGQATAADDATGENAELRGRIQVLENELRELKRAFNEARRTGLATGELQKIRHLMADDAEARAPKTFAVWANLDIQLYGYIKLDAAYDSSRTDNGNFARWVDSEAGRRDDNQFNMTARQTRLGMKIKGPDFGDGKTSGRVEIDFYEGGAENKPRPMMRHAYMKLDWPKDRFSIIAGQTSDVISPLLPPTLNYTVLWWAGNPGYRRPQIRVTKGFALTKDVDLLLQGALTRTIGHDTDFDPGDTGEDAHLPGFQGRAALTFPLLGGKKTTVGVSGHIAQEEYDIDATDTNIDLCSWSVNLDVALPVNDWLTLKGEMFVGQDLDAYLAGIGQGLDVNGDSITELRSCGGWIAASLGPWGKWRFNTGAGVEALDDDDVTSASTRVSNLAIFGNAIYQINENASVGFEISHWHTEYKAQEEGHSVRLQSSFIYKF